MLVIFQEIVYVIDDIVLTVVSGRFDWADVLGCSSKSWDIVSVAFLFSLLFLYQ